MATNSSAVSQDTLITIKISVNEQLKKLKLPLREVNIASLTPRVSRPRRADADRQSKQRYSDSAGGYITLDEKNPQVFKALVRAAKAKGKLRLRVTVTPTNVPQEKEAPVDAKKVAVKPMEPIIVRSTAPMSAALAEEKPRIQSAQAQPRDPISQQTLIDDAPVPHPFSVDRTAFFENLAAPAARSMLPVRPREPREKDELVVEMKHEWAIFCNECSKALPDSHYHCDICDGADYDLCEQCVAEGKLCPGDGHWLIKRFLKDGQFITSTTERVSPRKFHQASLILQSEPEIEEKMPGALSEETKTLDLEPMSPTRTCNNCVIVLPEREFVHCTSCEDFDLCIKCHMADKHGHHPAHGFELATNDTVLPLAAETKLAPGRNVRHNAICDGCDKKIHGVRHKCLNCPDWDYCNDCIKDARHTHPRHRFAPLYTPIADQGGSMVRHFGIYCDGPLCSQKAHASYIQGVRYKCTICHDTDFCANCEALPGNHHNRTHPLLKLKTPVRNVNVSTENEDLNGNVRVTGDRHAEPAAATQVVPIPVNAATPVQTVAEIKPTEVKKESLPMQIPVKKFETFPNAPQPQTFKLAPEVPMSLLNAHFVRDSIPDGMAVEPETQITQIWTLKNPGPYTWPAGCSVRYVGGDNMLNVDNSHPASVAAINEAAESNVVGREVSVGEEVAFKVVLKAPIREGKAISYWRLKAADGTPFGHRLWCDIEVKKNTNASPASNKTVESTSEKERRDILRQRVAHIKANIVKTREEREKLAQDLSKQKAAAAEKKADEAYEKMKNIIEQVAKQASDEEENDAEESLEGSQMVFPKLEKESPASSTYQSATSSSSKGKAAYVENEDGEVERSARPSPAQAPSTVASPAIEHDDFVDLDDELEVLSAADDSEDDGFLTDEEYDILDASDHE
ncbi:uncharacterized protein MYCFIDRAFT_114686, partial [Pseudocercospora fijiensis CIRAD86]